MTDEQIEQPQLPARTNERAGWLANIETRGSSLPDGWDPTGLASAYQVSALLARSGLVPRALQGKPEDVMVVLWTGKELGLSAMTALRHLFVVHGRVSMSAEMMRARAMAAPECEYLEVIESDEDHAVVEVKRKDRPARQVSFTAEEARRAGLIRDDSGWKKFPADMCVARASARAVRRYFPGVLGPAPYTPEEAMEMVETGPGQWSDAAGAAAATIVSAAQRPEKVVSPAPEPQPGVIEGEAVATDNVRGEVKRQKKVEPPEWQYILDMKIPGVGDEIAKSLHAAGIVTAEQIYNTGLEGLCRLRRVGKLSAQGMLLWAEKQLDPEPEMEPAEEPIADENGAAFDAAVEAGAAEQGITEEPPEIPFPPPAEAAKAEQLKPGPKLAAPPPPSKGQLGPKLKPTEVYSLVRHAVRTKSDGEQGLKTYCIDKFKAPLDQVSNTFYRALFDWAAAPGDHPAEGEAMQALRKQGLVR